ncbi:cellulose binding domain-containing protein [Marinimicrobium agarilyticum]|uniref:cellulose binding domain-containing protein n=1 Tax=Marinimicrobium agarilyticum TaxID=306546 RepID=UPI00040E795C|nr:cellulose binding domain-containing protein [Marinimicrobium agarilyticum]
MISSRQFMLASAMLFFLPLISSHVYALTCSVDADTWNTGYTLNVTVANEGSSAVSGWQVTLDFDQSPGISNSWNADLTTAGNTVTATNGSWNGNLSPGQSAGFGFQGTHNGNFALPECSTGGESSSSSLSSSVSSNNSTSSSIGTSSSDGGGGNNSITVRAAGTTGSESITLRVGGSDVQSWTLGTAMMDYSVETDLLGDIHVAFTNDNDGDADVQIDYVIVGGVTRQAEDQNENTGAWGNDQCGGGSNSEWLHCNGYINFGSVPGSSSSSSTSSSSASSSSSNPGGIGSVGCGSAPDLSAGRHSINVGGLNREYIIDIPNGYDMNNPYRLVFGWHWRGGSAGNVANDSYYGLKNEANGTAIFVAPDRAPGENGWTNTNGRDMDFLREMLDEFRNSLCIDESRIFSAGWSYGGMMSFAVGREMADTFRAIAPASGALWTPYEDNGGPIAAWISHGTNDSVVGYDAGVTARDLFVSANNCSNNTVPTQPSPCVEYQGCDAGHPVVWCSFNGGHTTPSFYSSAVWDFFSRF